jgi:hypothetical protein
MFTDKIDEITIVWGIDDVRSIAEDLTDDQCREVLQMAKNNHDANVGINWEVLEQYVEEVKNS